MPLFEMSPNVQEIDSVGRKRSHDEYAGDAVKVVDDADAKTPRAASIRPVGDSCEVALHRSRDDSLLVDMQC